MITFLKNTKTVTTKGHPVYFRAAPNNGMSEWYAIVKYLEGVREVRKSICVGCGHGKLYDNNGVVYHVGRSNTLNSVKDLVIKITQMNKSILEKK